MGSKFIVHDGIGPNIDRLITRAAAGTTSVMQSSAELVENYARTNAPWSDITGAARSGLNASVYEEDGAIVLELAHGVDYGYWLEVIQDGEFAIILPTLEALGPEILVAAGRSVIGEGAMM